MRSPLAPAARRPRSLSSPRRRRLAAVLVDASIGLTSAPSAPTAHWRCSSLAAALRGVDAPSRARLAATPDAPTRKPQHPGARPGARSAADGTPPWQRAAVAVSHPSVAWTADCSECCRDARCNSAGRSTGVRSPGCSDLMLELRLALVHEGVHAFLLVLGGEQRVEQRGARTARRRPAALSKARFTHSLAIITLGPLKLADRQRRGQRLVHQLVRRHDARDQAGALGLGRVHHAAGQHHVHRLGLATARGRRCVPPAPGMMPSLISGWPNFALSAAMMKSHIIASSQPPPSAKPATAAITGLRTLADRLPVAGDEVALVDVARSRSCAIAPMSAPAAKAFSLPVTTMQPMPSSASKALQRRAELVHQRVVQRVELLGAVQRDQAGLARAVAAHFGEDGFVVHRVAGEPDCKRVPRGLRRHGGWLPGPSARAPARACGRSPDRRRSRRPARSACAPAGSAAAARTRSPALSVAGLCRTRRGFRWKVGSGPNGVCSVSSLEHVVDPAVDAARQRQRQLDRAADAQQLAAGVREQVGQLHELAGGVLHARAGARAGGRWPSTTASGVEDHR